MTYVIRAATAMTNPPAGKVILPPLGVTGVMVRWDASTLAQADGETVTSLLDESGNGRHMTSTSGTPKVATLGGVKCVDLSTGPAVIQSAAFTANRSKTLAFSFRVTGASPGNAQIFSHAGTLMYVSNGKIYAYKTGALSGGSANITTSVWHTGIAVLNYEAQTGKIAYDGVITPGTITYAEADATSAVFKLASTGSMALAFRAAVMLDHAATDTEIAALHAALRKPLP